jgi:hypothetical protein
MSWGIHSQNGNAHIICSTTLKPVCDDTYSSYLNSYMEAPHSSNTNLTLKIQIQKLGKLVSL